MYSNCYTSRYLKPKFRLIANSRSFVSLIYEAEISIPDALTGGVAWAMFSC